MTEEKKRIRKEMRDFRMQLSDEDYAERSARLVENLLSLPEIEAAQTVHLYWPLTDRREPDIRPLVRELISRGKLVALPRVLPAVEREMEHVILSDENDLAPSIRGIPEPRSGPLIPAQRFDLILTPALAASRDGYRLGYGGGYYDAFLRDTHAVTVCAIFSEALLLSLPIEPHDEPVDVVVTDREIVRCCEIA